VEQERIIAEKISKVEDALEKERDQDEAGGRKEDGKKERERKESIKQMESKVSDAMENVKILNLRFEKVSKVKGELLKEAEGIMKGKVAEKIYRNASGYFGRVECSS
jgi:hypothetical protein